VMKSRRERSTFQCEFLETRNLLSAGVKADVPPGLIGNVNANGQGWGSATLTGNGQIGGGYTSVSDQAHAGVRSDLVHQQQDAPNPY
jgi:hypothetical protein